jgi:predicted Zn-dependent peptidase
MVVVGDVDADELTAALEQALGGWTGADAPTDAPPAQPPSGPTTIHVVDRPGAPQSELRIGHPGPPRGTPDYFPLLVLNTIFGGAFTSRLNSRLREEKGFTYGAGSAFAFRRHGGPFIASSAVFTGASAEAVGIVLHEMQRIREERVSAAELERARSYLALGLPRRLETTADVLRLASEQELHGLGDRFYDDYVERVRAVTADDVLRAAQQYLDPEHATVVVAGDHAAIASPLAALDVGAVVKVGRTPENEGNRTAS